MPVRLTTSLSPPEQITRAHVIAAEGPLNPGAPLFERTSSRACGIHVSLADEFENQWHSASLLLASRPYTYSKGNASAKLTKS
jgi:hypothetical protein